MSIERLQTRLGIGRSLDRSSKQSSFLSLQHSPQSSTLSPHHLVDISTELLNLGYSVRFRAAGSSMHPTIADGELITVEPVTPSNLKPGDIVLYRLDWGIIAHRVVRILRIKGSAPCFILQGDAAGACDYPVDEQQVLGKVASVERCGRSIDLYSRQAKIFRTAYVYASCLKKWIMRICL